MNKVIFDSAKVNAPVTTGFGFGVDAADWDLMADEAMYADALDRGVVGCSLEPIPAPVATPVPAAAPVADGEWTEADWNRATYFGLKTGTRRRPAPVPVATPAKVEPAPVVRQVNRPTDADRAEWARMTLESAEPGTFFVVGEARPMFGRQVRKPAPKRQANRTWQECRSADLDAIRPAGQPFDSPEWERYATEARIVESRYR